MVIHDFLLVGQDWFSSIDPGHLGRGFIPGVDIEIQHRELQPIIVYLGPAMSRLLEMVDWIFSIMLPNMMSLMIP